MPSAKVWPASSPLERRVLWAASARSWTAGRAYDNSKRQQNRTASAEGTNQLSRKNIVSSHKVIKTIAEINERIKKGRAVVLNAEEMTEAVRRMGPEKAAREVDVVTTGHVLAHVLVRFAVQHRPARTAENPYHPGLDERRPRYAGLAAVTLSWRHRTARGRSPEQSLSGPVQIRRRTRHRRSRSRAQRPSAGDLIRDGLLPPPVPRPYRHAGGSDLRTAFEPAQLLPELQCGGELYQPHDLYLHGAAQAGHAECELRYGGLPFAAVQ